MSLVSLGFTLFVIIGVFIYYICSPKIQWIILLLMSLLFYLSYDVKAVVFLLFSIVTIYCATKIMNFLDDSKNSEVTLKTLKNRKKIVLLIALISNFGLLGVVKYTNFFTENINRLLGTMNTNVQIPIMTVLAPIGISFYTFQATGYLLDVYWKKDKAEKNIFKLALFISFFPQIIQGPISKHKQLAAQFEEQHKFDLTNIQYGTQLILWGLFKKNVIADTAAVAVTAVLNDIPAAKGIAVIWGILCYCIQLYCDFSGGIDVIRGVAQLFGIIMIDNFKRPFFSQSISEFWRRWHISLGVWMKDYIFYPFSLSKGMIRFGQFSKKIFGRQIGRKLPICLGNLLVFFLVGVWHGASWNFIVYGLYNGMIIAISSLLEPLYQKLYSVTRIDKQSNGMKLFRIIRTFLLVNIGWYFDCAGSMKSAMMLFANTFKKTSAIIENGTFLGLSVYQYAIMLTGCAVLSLVSLAQERGIKVRERIDVLPLPVRWLLWIVLIYAIPLLGHYSQGAGGFMYAQF